MQFSQTVAVRSKRVVTAQQARVTFCLQALLSVADTSDVFTALEHVACGAWEGHTVHLSALSGSGRCVQWPSNDSMRGILWLFPLGGQSPWLPSLWSFLVLTCLMVNPHSLLCPNPWDGWFLPKLLPPLGRVHWRWLAGTRLTSQLSLLDTTPWISPWKQAVSCGDRSHTIGEHGFQDDLFFLSPSFIADIVERA